MKSKPTHLVFGKSETSPTDAPVLSAHTKFEMSRCLQLSGTEIATQGTPRTQLWGASMYSSPRRFQKLYGIAVCLSRLGLVCRPTATPGPRRAWSAAATRPAHIPSRKFYSESLEEVWTGLKPPCEVSALRQHSRSCHSLGYHLLGRWTPKPWLRCGDLEADFHFPVLVHEDQAQHRTVCAMGSLV